jgi:hypothetical protein
MPTVHKNLNRGCWTVKDTSKSKVRHVDSVALSGVSFVVQPAGRLRVLRERVRLVHAYAKGEPAEVLDTSGWAEVTYNPYRAGTFTTRDGTPVLAADYVVFASDGKAYGRGVR